MTDTLDFADPGRLSDPYPYFHRLRATDPVHWDESFPGGAWVVTRYADVAVALRDARLSSNRMPIFRRLFRDTDEAKAFDDSLSRSMLYLDPPQHGRMRSLVSKAFTPRMVETLRPRIQALTDTLLDAVAGQATMDVIRDLAYPLPVSVIAELLGVPTEDRHLLLRWAADITNFMGNLRGVKRAIASSAEFRAYLHALFVTRRAKPGLDLISALLAIEDTGETLSEEDLIATCILLLDAGHVTTTHLIGNGLLALLRHPDQLDLLREDQARVPAAVEELLRYDPTVQGFGRIAREDLELGGRPVKKGQIVLLMVAAANRDPEQFPDPDRLDVDRRDVRHLSFGLGGHYCLGAPLARVEGAIVLSALLGRFPRLRLTGEGQKWQQNFAFRGLEELRVAFD